MILYFNWMRYNMYVLTLFHKKPYMKMSVKLDNKMLVESHDKTVKRNNWKMKNQMYRQINDISFIHRKDWECQYILHDPYHSREKWLIERVNRRYIECSIQNLNSKTFQRMIWDRVTIIPNRRPKERLYIYRTPEQVFNDYLLHC